MKTFPAVLLSTLLVTSMNALANTQINDLSGYHYDDKNPFFYDSSDEGREKNKHWNICQRMIGHTTLVADTIAAVKRNPEQYLVNDEQNRDQLKQIYPTNEGTFQDTINAKTLEFGFANWEKSNDEFVNTEIAEPVWEWCRAQPSRLFNDL